MLKNDSGRQLDIVDVGGNVGVTSLLFSHLFPQGRITVVEPGLSTFESLKLNIRLNGRQNIHPRQCAVGDHAGLVWCDSSPSDRARASVASMHGGLGVVDSVSLDAYCENNYMDKISLLKVDVEGYEASVLLGASRLLRRRAIDVVYFESCPDNERRAGHAVGAAVESLVENDYVSWTLSNAGRLTAFSLSSSPLPTLTNLVALSPDVACEWGRLLTYEIPNPPVP